MLTRTTEMAIRALLVLGLEQDADPMTPRVLAERLDCSASYLSKTLGLLTKAGLLESVRGAHGGVLLVRKPTEITLRHIVEACQGVLMGDHCHRTQLPGPTCGYHRAMQDVHNATLAALARWTLADMLQVPVHPVAADVGECKMYFKDCETHTRRLGNG